MLISATYTGHVLKFVTTIKKLWQTLESTFIIFSDCIYEWIPESNIKNQLKLLPVIRIFPHLESDLGSYILGRVGHQQEVQPAPALEAGLAPFLSLL